MNSEKVSIENELLLYQVIKGVLLESLSLLLICTLEPTALFLTEKKKSLIDI